MTKRQTPPGRKSKECVVVEKPSGPHHCARCLGSVKAANTSSRGASNTRRPMIARGSVSKSMLFFAATLRLLGFCLGHAVGLQRLEVVVEPVEPLLPQPAVFLQPIVGLLERVDLDLAGTHLRVAAARDQTGALEHFEVLGHGGQADGE